MISEKQHTLSPYTAFDFDGVTAIYYEHGGHMSMTLVPTGMEHEVKASKLALTEPMVQLCINGVCESTGYIAGVSYHNASEALGLKLVRQYTEQTKDGLSVITEFLGRYGIFCSHRLTGKRGYVRSSVTVRNDGDEAFDLYDLPSFSINGLTPFTDGAAYDDLRLHRFTSHWSAEGRHQCDTLEALNLEPSWTRWAAKTFRISQVGTMPIREHFPFLALEDTRNGVVWAAELEYNGSWQMELYRQKENVVLGGGLADYMTGHWFKTLGVGESITTPEAILTAVKGGLDDACDRLLCAQEDALLVIGEAEERLAPLYNEYCDTWNDPTYESVCSELESIKDMPFAYFVIDAGWNGRDGVHCLSNNGDWYTNERRFPGGLRSVSEMIRNAGMVAGLWFEPEAVSTASAYYRTHTNEFIRLNGHEVNHTGRAFFDMSTEHARQFMKENVIDVLKDNGFGYIKIDYNDNLGLGFDGYESIGEGIRRSAYGTYRFFEDMREAIPSLIIENCAAGGHRLEPGMMRRASMASFSDAHECVDIPLIAADLQRLILPRQSQIWAVIRHEDPLRRIVYSCVNTLLGRMCVSGNVASLNEAQMQTLKEGVAFYTHAAPIIKSGKSKCYREGVTAYREPKGWQAVVRAGENGALVALNVFQALGADVPYTLTVTDARLAAMEIDEIYAEKGCTVTKNGASLTVTVNGDFSAMGIILK